MSNFKEGDIIVKNNFTYVCRLVGEKEAMFNKRWFGGMFNAPSNWGVSGCSEITDYKCNDYVILHSDKCKFIDKGDNLKQCCLSNKYPVIGNYTECSTVFNLDVFKKYYKEEYEKYITMLYDRIESKSSKDIIEDVEKASVIKKEKKK